MADTEKTGSKTKRLMVGRGKIRGDFIKRVKDLTGQDPQQCYQCGKCSAGCPLAEEMDMAPHQIIRYLQLGEEAVLLGSETIWMCASCLMCATRCPKGYDLAKAMEALRTILTRKGVDRAGIKKISRALWKKMPQQALVSGFRKFT